jgi:hypothetical protein
MRYLTFSGSTPAKPPFHFQEKTSVAFRTSFKKKIKKSPVSYILHLVMMKNDQNNNFMLKTGDILNF